MKSKSLILAVALTLIVSGYVFAGYMKKDGAADAGAAEQAVVAAGQATEAAAEATEAAADAVVAAAPVMEKVEVGNKICPIEGGPIDPAKMAQVEHNGKVYNLCCSMCEKAFKDNPEAAIQRLEATETAAPAVDGT